MRLLRPLALLLALLLAAACTGEPARPPVRVGAIYPLSGTQGMGGIDEFHGVQVAAELINAEGGIGGRPVELDQVDVPEADAAYRKANGHSMSAAALAGFSGAWALFRHVLPEASSLAPTDVAAAARRARVPAGGLPNGSGLQFAPPGGVDAGANLRAASVIWEWTKVNQREVTWPPQFATAPIATLRPTR